MDATIPSLEKLGKAFDKFYFPDGNSDLYYKDRRDVNHEICPLFPVLHL